MILWSLLPRARRLVPPCARLLSLGLLAVLVALVLPSIGAAAGSGALTQPAVPNGCASNDGTSGNCVQASPLGNPQRVAVSPDNKHVYVTSFGKDAITVFGRDTKTSVLTKLSCISQNAITADGCLAVKPLIDPRGIVVSPDGKHVYVGANGSGAVVVLNRDKKTGVLTKASCVSNGSVSDCAHPVTPLVGPEALAISKDGKHVFVAVLPASAANAAVVAFSRDKTDGSLTRVNCISNQAVDDCTVGVALAGAADLAVTDDGKNLYVASGASNAVAVLSIDKKTGTLSQVASPDGCVSSDGTGGACDQGSGLGKPQGVAVSVDGKHVYVASTTGDAVALFSRDKKTGTLSQLGCISNGGSGGCDSGTALDGAYGVDVSQDGNNVYVTANVSDAVAVFARDKKTGLLNQLAPTNGCVSLSGTGGACAAGVGLDGAQGLAITKDGKSVYVVGNASDAVAAFSRAK
jgi:DNA-binding beta-propeller fold protein YncE